MDSRIRNVVIVCLGAAAWLMTDLAGPSQAAEPAGSAVVRANNGDYYDCNECPPAGCRPGCCGILHLGRHCQYSKEKLRRAHYVYRPLDPGYRDARDVGPFYSEQGHNVPIASPLAPVVMHSYNYSWGLPASRLTRVGPPHRW